MTRVRLSALAALSLLYASAAWADLRTFDVEPQYQQEVFAALRDILTPDPDRGLMLAASGRVEVLPSGQILVNASPDTLEQVEKVLQTIRTQSAAATPRAALRYWAVLGTAPTAAAANGGPVVLVVPNQSDTPRPVPPVLNGVLTELRRLHGDLTFKLLGTAALATDSGQFGQVKGTTLSVEQTAHVQGNTLNAAVSLELSGTGPPGTFGNMRIGQLSLRTSLNRGEFVVLGESHVQVGANDGPVFYIVHWER